MTLRKTLAMLLTLLCLSISQPAQAATQDTLHEKYQLVQVFVLSRHNIRAPIAGKDSVLAKMTDHKWHDFGVKNGHLTARGALMEHYMGTYFRNYLQQEGLFPADYQLQPKDLFFYANSFQRTIATARNFAQGMFPEGTVDVTYTRQIDEADPVFMPGALNRKPAFNEANAQELQALGGSQALTATISKGVATAATVLDRPVISLADFNIGVKDGLQITGAARPLMFTCDALVLQYYELGDKRATFGHELTFQQWQEIAAVKDLGIHAYRHLPTLSRARSRSLLSIMQEELNLQRRKFTFLCGHDSNVASVMCALEVKDTPLPDTIEQETPIGCKLVVEEWQDKDGESYVSLKLVYPTSQQLVTATPLTADNPPGMIPLHLQNIHANEDGLITLQDFQQRLTDAITSDAELTGQHY